MELRQCTFGPEEPRVSQKKVPHNITDSCFHIVYPKSRCYHANVTAEIKVLSDQVMFLHVGKEDQQFLKYPGPCNTSNHGTVFMPQCTELLSKLLNRCT